MANLSRAYVEVSQIPHLPLLRSQLHKKCRHGDDGVSANEGYLEQLPHSLASTAYALLKIFRAEHAALCSARERADDSAGTHVLLLEQQERDPIVFAIDHFFDSAVRAQNATTWYMSKTLSLSLPKSLSNICRKLDGYREIQPEMKAILQTYWTQSGKRLRDYRDLSQHFAVVPTEGRVYLLPSENAQIHVILPNNPEETDIKKLVYGDPDVNAYGFALNAYQELYRFVFDMTESLLAMCLPVEEHIHVINFKGGMRFDDRHIGQLLQSEQGEVAALLDFVAGVSRKSAKS